MVYFYSRQQDFPLISEGHLPVPKKALFLKNEGRNRNGKSFWSVVGINVTDIEFNNYLLGRMESWEIQNLKPHLREKKFSDYKANLHRPGSISTLHTAIVEFSGLVDFSNSL